MASLKRDFSPIANVEKMLSDPDILGHVMPGYGDRSSSWWPWFVVFKAVYLIPMNDEEKEFWAQITGGLEPPKVRPKEIWLIVGRRGGKSVISSVFSTIEATAYDYRPLIRPGEKACILNLSSDQDQSKTVLGYTKGNFSSSKILSGFIKPKGDTIKKLELINRVTIFIRAAMNSAVRGFTVVGAIMDEIAHWKNKDQEPISREVYEAIKPALLTIPNSLIFCITSPGRKEGILWDIFQEYFGKQSDRVIVIKADTLTMNPLADKDEIDEAYRVNPAWAATEFGAEFRDDLDGFLWGKWIDMAVRQKPFSIEPVDGVHYRAFVDPSGGRHDAMVLAIGHKEGRIIIVDDLLYQKSPFKPKIVVSRFAKRLAEYGLSKVYGDHYSAEWVVESFKDQGISYITETRDKSRLYLESEGAFTQSRLEMPNSDLLIKELKQLERKETGGGRIKVDHRPHGTDDLANAVCGLTAILQDNMMVPNVGVVAHTVDPSSHRHGMSSITGFLDMNPDLIGMSKSICSMSKTRI